MKQLHFRALAFSSFLVVLGGCTGNSSSTTNATPGSTALEGTWDIASYASEDIAPSSVTVVGGKLSGALSYPSGSAGCARTLEFAIEGNSMTGSSSPSGPCPGAKTTTIAGTRTTSQPDSNTPWNGTWTIQSGTSKGDLTISGLSATSGDFRISVAGGVANGSGSTRYTFVARRR